MGKSKCKKKDKDPSLYFRDIPINEYGEPTNTQIGPNNYLLIQEGWLLVFGSRAYAEYFLKHCTIPTYRAGRWIDINYGFNGIANLSRIYKGYFKCESRPAGYKIPKCQHTHKGEKYYAGDCYEVINLPCKKGDGKGKNKSSAKANHYRDKKCHKYNNFRGNWW